MWTAICRLPQVNFLSGLIVELQHEEIQDPAVPDGRTAGALDLERIPDVMPHLLGTN